MARLYRLFGGSLIRENIKLD